MNALLRILSLPACLLSSLPGLRPVLRALSTSVGQKFLMAVSGLSLVGFLVVHLGGNLQLFAGEDVFNAYAEKLHSLGPILAAAEVGLFSMFALHIGLALSTSSMNRLARRSDYAMKQTKQGLFVLPSGGASAWMMATGVLIGIFLVTHILDMKLKKGFDVDYSAAMVDGVPANSYQAVRAVLSHPVHAGIYVVCLIALGIHLSHGVRSSLQTLGLNHRNWNFLLKAAGITAAWLIAGGFISLVVWALGFQA
ncbi:MAG: succinate dehydrogenase cytochrome b subunit [Planctomycetota bacterium]